MYTLRDKTAIHYKGRDYSYDAFSRHVHCYARGFGKEKPAARVLLFAHNSAEWVFALYGTWANEGIAIPVDEHSTLTELSYIIEDARPDIIFTTEDKKPLVREALQSLDLHLPVFTGEDMDLSGVERAPAAAFSPKDREQTALINYTSGTTGHAKGVMLSFNNLFYIVDSVSKKIKIFREDRNTMVLLPTHHILPLMGSIVAPLYTGASIYIAENLSTEAIINTLVKGKIAIIIGVPRLYETLAKGILSKINAGFATRWIYRVAGILHSRFLSRKIFKSVHDKFGGHVRFMVSGGAALAPETGRIFKTLGFEILEGYGMTEMAPLISFTHPGKWSVGYAGYPLAGMDFKIEEGEICVKGPNLMQGYFNKPEETAEAVVDGWLHTGDLGFLEKKGLKLTGRKKELLVTSNGKKIDPVELENGFYKHAPLIKEVGIFMHGNVIQALVYPDMDAMRSHGVQDLQEEIRRSILSFNETVAPYKRVKGFHLVSEELPKTQVGKLKRFQFPGLFTRKEIAPAEDEKKQGQGYRLLQAFIEGETGVKPAENSHFEIDLAMDSLSRVALLAYIENTFNIPLNEKDLHELNTLGKLSQYIEKQNKGINLAPKPEWKEILTSKISHLSLPEAGWLQKSFNIIIRYLLRIVYRYKSRGMANIPNEPCILVANHQSMLDGVLITSNLNLKINKKTYLFAKEKYWRNRIMHFMAQKNNVVLMDINHNLKEAIQKLSYLLRNGKNVIIFPEGTRSKNGILDFKETFAILSKELNVPIVPIAINGSDRAVYQKVRIPRYCSRLSVDFLETIYPKREESYQELKNRVKEKIAERLKKQ